MSDLFENPHGFSGCSGAAPVGKKIPVEYPKDCAGGFAKALKKLFATALDNPKAGVQNRFPGQSPASRENRQR